MTSFKKFITKELMKNEKEIKLLETQVNSLAIKIKEVIPHDKNLEHNLRTINENKIGGEQKIVKSIKEYIIGDDFLDSFSRKLDLPKKEETKEEFLERGLKIARKILKRKFT